VGTLRSTLEWSKEDVSTSGVRQRHFVVGGRSHPVPGLLWTPAGDSGPRPLVLVCHGAGNTKRDAYVLALARRLVRHHSFAAAAIDGPVHGDRRSDGSEDGALMFLEFNQLWNSDPSMIDEMVTDWRATLDALKALDEIGTGPVGWWGLSMGTILGVPVVAAEERIEVAVLGLMGTRGPNAWFRERVVADARRIGCPVLFLLQWDDELVRREDALDLFGEIGATDKRLHAHPGGHVEVPREGFYASVHFLADHLAQ
jgi:dienelactone hydrolase